MVLNWRFAVLAVVASLGWLMANLMMPVTIPGTGFAGQVIISVIAGVLSALWFTRTYPDAPLTPKAIFFLTPWWVWAALVVIFFVSGMLQGMNPLQMVGIILAIAAVWVGIPWLLWVTLKDVFHSK